MNDLTVSLIQFRSVLGDTEGNCRRMTEYAESLSGTSDVICFPEASLTGYTSRSLLDHSISATDEHVLRLKDAAVENNMVIVFGFLEKDGNGRYITQAIADGQGTIRFYRKTHLGRDERSVFLPGNTISATETPKAVIGPALCWESHFPEIFTKLRKEGAELVLISYASPLKGDRRRDIWMKHIPARAADNCVFAGVVNAVGDQGEGTAFGGGSMIFDPKGRILGEYFGSDEHVLTVSLSSEIKSSLGSDAKMGSIDYFMYRREELY